MHYRLTKMDGSGDTEFKWDPMDPKAVADMRETVGVLKAQGFVFFLVDGRPADEVEAGNGALSVRRLDPDDITPDPPAVLARVAAEPESLTPTGRKRRGRIAAPQSPAVDVLAHRRVAGG